MKPQTKKALIIRVVKLRGTVQRADWAATWKKQKSECAPSEDSDQPEHPPSLIRVLAVRMKTVWVLSYTLSASRSLWSDWADAQADLSLRWAHTHFVGFVMSRLRFIEAQQKGLFSQKLRTHCFGLFRQSFIQASVPSWGPSTPVGHFCLILHVLISVCFIFQEQLIIKAKSKLSAYLESLLSFTGFEDSLLRLVK